MKIVLTNGCFDGLHEGHRYLLEKAAALGDYLIVAVNHDKSVTDLKGHGRPLYTLSERMAMLEALTLADAVIPFDGNPEALVVAIRCHILVKGDDYREQDVRGGFLMRQWGGKVHIIKRLAGISTTEIARAHRSVS